MAPRIYLLLKSGVHEIPWAWSDQHVDFRVGAFHRKQCSFDIPNRRSDSTLFTLHMHSGDPREMCFVNVCFIPCGNFARLVSKRGAPKALQVRGDGVPFPTNTCTSRKCIFVMAEKCSRKNPVFGRVEPSFRATYRQFIKCGGPTHDAKPSEMMHHTGLNLTS